MAARINKINHDEKTKRLIQASQLLNRLNQFAIGEIEMTQAQVNAAKCVIGKTIPDTKSVDVQMDIQGDVTIGWRDPHSLQSEAITGEPS
jgi:hypothetical protein